MEWCACWGRGWWSRQRRKVVLRKVVASTYPERDPPSPTIQLSAVTSADVSMTTHLLLAGDAAATNASSSIISTHHLPRSMFSYVVNGINQELCTSHGCCGSATIAGGPVGHIPDDASGALTQPSVSSTPLLPPAASACIARVTPANAIFVRAPVVFPILWM